MIFNTVIKVLGMVVSFLCAFSLKAERDTTYIKPFPGDMAIRIYLSEKFPVLSYQDGKNEEVNFRPYSPVGIGLGITWNKITISGSIGIYGPENKSRGKSRSYDLQYHYYGKKFVFDAFALKYEGFYPEDNEDDFYSGMKAEQYGVSGQYVFNSDRFSYRAAFVQKERQARSAGSFILGGGIYYMEYQPTISDAQESSPTIRNYQAGASFGYAHTWVFARDYYVSLSLIGGANLGNKSISEIFRKPEVYPTFFPRFSMGYNNDNWSVGFQGLVNLLHVTYSDENKVRMNTFNVRFSLMRRFNLSDILKKKKTTSSKTPYDATR